MAYGSKKKVCRWQPGAEQRQEAVAWERYRLKKIKRRTGDANIKEIETNNV